MSKKLSRREFLKLLASGAAAAGLSHFRILNVGGVMPVLADDDCTDPGETDPDECTSVQSEEDTCMPHQGENDECSSHDYEDYCIPGEEPQSPADLCRPGEPANDPDVCEPALEEEDSCIPPDDTDYACPAPGADACFPFVDPDLCSSGEEDLCEPLEEEPDVCEPWHIEPEPDVCDPGIFPDEPDYGCDPMSSDECLPPENPDLCNPYGGDSPDDCLPQADPDNCTPWFGEPDECMLSDDTDHPTPVKLNSLTSSGGVATLLGAAAAIAGMAAVLSDDK